MENTLRYWEKYETTPPEYIEAIPNGKKLSSVNPTYRRKMFTECFGPEGSGWGVMDEYYDFKQFGDDVYSTIITYTAKLWYLEDKERCILPIRSSKNVYEWQETWSKVKKGEKEYQWIQQDDIYKKVSTSALMQGFGRLGFNADVYIGNAETPSKATSNQSKPSPSNEKPWLNQFLRDGVTVTENWQNVEKYLQEGGKISEVKKKFRINKDNLKDLEAIVNAVAA